MCVCVCERERETQCKTSEREKIHIDHVWSDIGVLTLLSDHHYYIKIFVSFNSTSCYCAIMDGMF